MQNDNNNTLEIRAASSDPPSPPPPRAYRAKGPTLGKGKACELCRSRRVRCNGAHPSCSNCVIAGKECVYVGKPRPPSSTSALSAKLAGLEERYKQLSEMAASENDTGSPPQADTEMDWDASVDFPALPPVQSGSMQSQFSTRDDPYLENRMTKKDRKTMIELYLRECYRYSVFIAPSNLVAKLDDPNPKKRPHPCLFSAMMLVARDMTTRLTLEAAPDEHTAQRSSFFMPESTPSVDELIARVQAQCTQSLADVDRLLDYIQASLLLAHWYITHGRVLEGQYTSAVVNRFIINCQLHQIDQRKMRELAPGTIPSQDGASLWDGSLLGRPKDREELAIRISVFWESYFLDKIIRMITGAPPTYDETDVCRITTAFPRTRDEYVSGTAFELPYASIDSLFDSRLFPSQFQDSLGTLEMKALTLLDRAMRFVVRPPSYPDEVISLQENIKKLKSATKQLFSSPAYTRPPINRSRALFVTTSKAVTGLLGLTAEIHATHIKASDGSYMLFDDEDAAIKSRVDAAHACATVIAIALDEVKAMSASLPPDAGPLGIEQTCFTIGLLLTVPAGVLIESLGQMDATIERESVGCMRRMQLEQEKRDDELQLKIMLDAINAFRDDCPIVENYWQIVQQCPIS